MSNYALFLFIYVLGSNIAWPALVLKQIYKFI